MKEVLSERHVVMGRLSLPESNIKLILTQKVMASKSAVVVWRSE